MVPKWYTIFYIKSTQSDRRVSFLHNIPRSKVTPREKSISIRATSKMMKYVNKKQSSWV
eukprot:UN12635